MPKLKPSSERALAKFNRLISIKNPDDLVEALRTPGTPAYQQFWNWVWLNQLSEALLVEKIILQFLRQDRLTAAERRAFLQSCWQQQAQQALKDQDTQFENGVAKPPLPQLDEKTLESTGLVQSLSNLKNFRHELTEKLTAIEVKQKQVELEWQGLQAQKQDGLWQENAGATLLCLNEKGQFFEVTIDPNNRHAEVQEIFKASQVKLIDEPLVRALAASYDFDVQKPEPIVLPEDSLQQLHLATTLDIAPTPQKKESILRVADMMKRGNVLAELKANATCLKKHNFEDIPQVLGAPDKPALEVSQALLAAVNHNRKVFNTLLPTQVRNTEEEMQRNARLQSRKEREIDLLTHCLVNQLSKIECEKACLKADAAIAHLEKLVIEETKLKTSTKRL